MIKIRLRKVKSIENEEIIITKIIITTVIIKIVLTIIMIIRIKIGNHIKI